MPGKADRPNVVLLVLDGLRGDRISGQGYPRPTTPYLDSLAEEAVVALHHHTASSYSLSAHISLFTGLTPQFHGTGTNLSYFVGGVPYLTTELKARGYRTAGISTKNPYLTLERGFVRRFDRYLQVVKTNRALHAKRDAETPAPGRLASLLGRLRGGERAKFEARRREYLDFYLWNDLGGAAIVEEASALVRDWSRRGDPFFLFINVLDPHSPYLPPAGYRDLFGAAEIDDNLFRALYNMVEVKGEKIVLSAEETEMLQRLYDGGVRYADDLTARFLSPLLEDGTLQGSVVVVTSDHGEMLNDCDRLMGHGSGLRPGILKVPLILRPPGGARLRIDRVTSICDIFPTILGMVGGRPLVPYSSVDLLARDVAPREFVVAEAPPLPESERIYARYPKYITKLHMTERAWVTRDWIFVWRGTGDHRLYAAGDPTSNRFERERAVAERAVADLTRYYAEGPAGRRPVDLAHFPCETLPDGHPTPPEALEAMRREQDSEAILTIG